MKTFITFGLTLFLASHLWAAENIPARNWTSTKGTSINAVATGIESGKVVLRKANGKTLRVALHLLVDSDQELLKNHFTKKKPTDKWLEDDTKEKTKRGKINKDGIKQEDVDGKEIYLPYELGETKKGIELDKKLAMDIYVPSTLRANEKYSVMIVLDPAHGTQQHIAKFTSAADENEMIIVTLPKLHMQDPKPKNKKPDVDVASVGPYIKKTLRQLKKDFPIDSKRIYFAGYGDGGFIALYATQAYKGAGTLVINGGGKGQYSPSNRRAFVGLCATASKQRWDMASTYKKCKGSSVSHLSFYTGKGWPNTTLINEGIFRLNGMFLLKHSNGTHAATAARYEKEFVANLEGVSGDVEESLLWLNFANQYTLQDPKNIEKLENANIDFETNEGVQAAKEAHKDVYKAFLRYFGGGWDEYVEDNGKKSTASSFNRLKEKHGESMYASILSELANAAK